MALPRFPASHKFLKTYAQDFVKFYRNLPQEELTDVLEPAIVSRGCMLFMTHR